MMTKCDECGCELDAWSIPDDHNPADYQIICEECCNKLGITIEEEWL